MKKSKKGEVESADPGFLYGDAASTHKVFKKRKTHNVKRGSDDQGSLVSFSDNVKELRKSTNESLLSRQWMNKFFTKRSRLSTTSNITGGAMPRKRGQEALNTSVYDITRPMTQATVTRPDSHKKANAKGIDSGFIDDFTPGTNVGTFLNIQTNFDETRPKRSGVALSPESKSAVLTRSNYELMDNVAYPSSSMDVHFAVTPFDQDKARHKLSRTRDDKLQNLDAREKAQLFLQKKTNEKARGQTAA